MENPSQEAIIINPHRSETRIEAAPVIYEDNYDYGINGNDFYDYIATDMIDRAKSKTFYGTNAVNKPFLNNVFFNIKNNTYEVTIMWSLLIITIILLLSLLLKDANDEIETERVI